MTAATIWPNHCCLTADIVVFSAIDGVTHVLLIRRADDSDAFPGDWALPGGHTERHETSRQAATRELAEETGIRVHPDHLVQVGIYDQPDRDPRDRVISVAYTVALPEAPPPTAGDDAADAQWTPLDTALDMALAFDHTTILADLKRTR